MPDMLVKLYELPELSPVLAEIRRKGIILRPARTLESGAVGEWIHGQFPFWQREAEATLSRVPTTCHIALLDGRIVGFACYDAFCPNFFGPTGVEEIHRGKGIGKALLLATLHAQKAQGYAYAIIGGVGPAEYYSKTVGATLIDGSHPGIYDGLLIS
jgi:GNAT superfamily N-acetyltransferase